MSISLAFGVLDTVGEFGERYGTGSGSDLVDPEVVAYKAPGRYRSLYRTNSPTVSYWFDMLLDASSLGAEGSPKSPHDVAGIRKQAFYERV